MLLSLLSALALLAHSAAPAGAASSAPTDTSPAPTYGSSGMGGGGAVNALAIAQPSSTCSGTDSKSTSTRDLLAGGDVFGLDLSTDGGQSWAPEEQGITDPQNISAAAVGFESGSGSAAAGTIDEAYAWVGKMTGSGGQLLVAHDCGRQAWANVYPGSGGGTAPAIGANMDRPREVGHLLNVVSQTLMIGGAANGLFAFTRTGPTVAWCSGSSFCGPVNAPALPSVLQVRGLAKDPADPSVMLLTYGPGPDEFPKSSTAAVPYGVAAVGVAYPTAGQQPTLSVVSGPVQAATAAVATRNTPHDVTAVDLGTAGVAVYVAFGTDGVRGFTYASNTLTGGALVGSLGSNHTGASIAGDWTSVTSYADPTSTSSPKTALVFAGCTSDDPHTGYTAFTKKQACSAADSVYSLQAKPGADWMSATPDSSVSTTQLTHDAGSSSPWWYSFAGDSSLNGARYVASQLLVDTDAPSDPSPVTKTSWLLSGSTGGVWRGKIDAGVGLQIGGWQPASNGLAATEDWSVSADANHGVSVGDTDWGGVFSTNDMSVDPQPIHAAGGGGTVYATAFLKGRHFFGSGVKDFGGANAAGSASVDACDRPGSGNTFPSAPDCGTGTAPGSPPQTEPLGTPGDDPTTTTTEQVDRVVGLAVGQTANQNSSSFELVAAGEMNEAGQPDTQDSGAPLPAGLWVRSSDAATGWHRISQPGTTKNRAKIITATENQNHHISVVWSTGAHYMFVFDPATAEVFRSPDLIANPGLWTSTTPWTFTPIYTNSDIHNLTGTNYMVGDLSQQTGQVADPSALWLSTNVGVIRLTGVQGPASSVNGQVLTGSGGNATLGTAAIGIDRAPGTNVDSIVVVRDPNPAGNLQAARWTATDTTTSTAPTLNYSVSASFLDQAFKMVALTVSYTSSGERHEYIANINGGGLLVAPAPVK